jgi:hypothetical protein
LPAPKPADPKPLPTAPAPKPDKPKNDVKAAPIRPAAPSSVMQINIPEVNVKHPVHEPGQPIVLPPAGGSPF